MSEPVIQFEEVSCRVGQSTLVEGLSLSVARGETLVLLGQSGSGKTSTLKLVNHLLMPSTGRVLVEGKETMRWDAIALRRRIGYVIQEAGLFPHFKVEDNVGLVPALEGWDASRRSARVEEVMRLVGLEPHTYAGRYPFELSGGQRQRVGVARALAADPPILLMDEPFGALDPQTRADLQHEFRELQRKLHKTVLFVTHDVTEALLLGARIALMETGRIVASGTPAEFLKSENDSVRAFLQPVRDMMSLVSNGEDH
jgi:osmoprotectant transport system ATP-binding protein